MLALTGGDGNVLFEFIESNVRDYDRALLDMHVGGAQAASS